MSQMFAIWDCQMDPICHMFTFNSIELILGKLRISNVSYSGWWFEPS